MGNFQTKRIAEDKELRTIIFRITNKRDGTTIKEHGLSALPQSFSLAPMSRDTLQHTPGGIFEDRWGVAASRLQMAGVVLNEITLGAGDALDGAARFKDLRDMLNDYIGDRVPNTSPEIEIRVGNELRRVNRSDTQLEVLIFAPTLAPSSAEELAREWYAVVLNGSFFNFSKNVGDRHTNFPFSLSLTLIKRLDAGAAPKADVPADVKETARQAPQYLARTQSFIADVQNVIAKGTRIYDTATDFANSFSDLADSLERVAQGIDSFIRTPFRLVRGMATDLERIRQVYETVIDFPDAVLSEITATAAFLDAILAHPSAFAPELVGENGRSFNSSISRNIARGDTIEKIAFANNVTADDLIRLNQLGYPYIDDTDTGDGAPVYGKRVLRLGDTILVPRSTSTDDDGVFENVPSDFLPTPQTAEERFFGTAWVVDEDGNMRGNSARTGFLRVGGIDNVLQALRMRLQTRRGTVLEHPEIGMEPFIGDKASRARMEIVRVDAHQQVRSDPRIGGVERTMLQFEDGTIDVEIYSRLKGISEPVRLNLENLRTS